MHSTYLPTPDHIDTQPSERTQTDSVLALWKEDLGHRFRAVQLSRKTAREQLTDTVARARTTRIPRIFGPVAAISGPRFAKAAKARPTNALHGACVKEEPRRVRHFRRPRREEYPAALVPHQHLALPPRLSFVSFQDASIHISRRWRPVANQEEQAKHGRPEAPAVDRTQLAAT